MSFHKEISNVLSYISANGYQIHPEAFNKLKIIDSKKIMKIVQDVIKYKKSQKDNSLILLQDVEFISGEKTVIEIKKEDMKYEIKDNKKKIISSNSDITKPEIQNYYKILFDANDNIDTLDGINGYTSLFKSRFEKSLKILALRPESKRINKISNIKQKNRINSSKIDTNNTFIIAGLLMSRRLRKNSLELILDDHTGLIETLAVTEESINVASKLSLDQMVMLEIEQKNVNFIIKRIITPDIPDHISNKSKNEVFVLLFSDLHVGSKYFQEKEFRRFLNWINSSNNEIVNKIKFICIAGDLIDGVGIFPNQDKELSDINVNKQMEHVIDLISKIPDHIQIFIIPGNHDLGRRSLPQPAIPFEKSKKLYSLKNITMLGNPSFIELNGVKILLFHGQSLDDIIATVPGLSYSNPAEAMKMLLKARHLSPIYGQRTPVSPEMEDIMVISDVPDIFHSGHIHVIDVQNYKGTLIVNSGAWQNQTPFQQTMGITPTPGIAILVNLSNLKPYKIDFNQEILP
ncbi:MAG: DNA-directed DNA polymerase II small subunit [Nitrososphaeraceae archaeon]